MWQTFLDALDDSVRVARQPAGLWLTFKAQVIRAGSHEVKCKADLPKVISAQKGTWICVADPQRAELHPRQESRDALRIRNSGHLAKIHRMLREARAASPRGLGAQQWTFCLPAASDNTAAEAQTEKRWSTAEPLGSFLKLTAAWAARRHIELLMTHLAGERNAWADELISRGRLKRFEHRTAERVSIGLHQFLDASGCLTLHPPSAA